MKIDHKIIVVGSGPGGSITSLQLQKAGFDILLIERGGKYTRDTNKYYSYDEMLNKFNNAGLTFAYGSPFINYVEGSCFGGGSEVNSGLYHRLPIKILNNWKQEFGVKYNENELNNIYTIIEKKLNVSFLQDESTLISKKLKIGSEKLGYKSQEIPRWIKYDGKKIIKQSMSETYLREYLNLGGKVILNSTLIKIKKFNNILHLIIKTDNKVKTITAEKIFLCMGSIYSPYILLKSGIKRQVGNTLKLHPTFKFSSEFEEIINFSGMGIPVHQVKQFEKISIGCSISKKEYIGISLIDSNKFTKLRNWERMANYYIMVCPEGHGKVRKLPYFDSPFISFKMTKKDIINLKFGIKKLAEILFASGAIELYPSASYQKEIKKLNDLSPLLNMRIGKYNLMTIHLFSSLRMGADKKKYALNPYGRLWDYNNIYVNDGSMLCDSPTVNPQGTIMALAQYNINHFINENN